MEVYSFTIHVRPFFPLPREVFRGLESKEWREHHRVENVDSVSRQHKRCRVHVKHCVIRGKVALSAVKLQMPQRAVNVCVPLLLLLLVAGKQFQSTLPSCNSINFYGKKKQETNMQKKLHPGTFPLGSFQNKTQEDVKTCWPTSAVFKIFKICEIEIGENGTWGCSTAPPSSPIY